MTNQPPRARVRLHSDFLDDVRDQIDWLRVHRDASWIEELRAGIHEALDLLAAQPRAGRSEEAAAGEEGEARWLTLRRLPFVTWYAVEPEGKTLWVLRLFHARQEKRGSFAKKKSPRRKK